jgi:L,D-peptidoglycan transpeptidase YkuD (ErfK/YbiS/YcfS/YnhG family)
LRWKAAGAAFCLSLLVFACRTPPVPSEVREADTLDRELWGAGGSLFPGNAYDAFRGALRKSRRVLDEENQKLGWMRDYVRVRAEYGEVIVSGRALLAEIRAVRVRRMEDLASAAAKVRERCVTLEGITLAVGEHGRARQCLARAGVLLEEALRLEAQGRMDEAQSRIEAAVSDVRLAEEVAVELLGRYFDRRQVAAWRALADETVRESRERGTTVIVISKLEHKLTLYRAGVPAVVCDVGLGFNGLSDKRHAGDSATPEGRYKVTRKNPSSRFYKALLINYPNDEDQRRFDEGRRVGAIPARVGIGGMVEIHGGGRDSLTEGCVSVDDDVMDRIYALAAVGTSVTIVGTADTDNPILKALKDN